MLLLGTVYFASLRPGYSHISNTISELGEIGAPHAALAVFNFFLPVFLPHGDNFEVRFTNLGQHPISIWRNLCEPGHSALSFHVRRTNGESRSVLKTEVSPTSPLFQ